MSKHISIQRNEGADVIGVEMNERFFEEMMEFLPGDLMFSFDDRLRW